MTHRIPILLYHDLQSPDFPSEKSNEAASNTVVDVDNFEAQIRYLFENGYKAISIKDYMELRSRNNSILPRSIIITFDDGHYSNYYLAYPVLVRYGFRATFFIITDRINKEYHLTARQIGEMANNGMEIGSHGLTHKFLPLMGHEEMEKELRDSKIILESIIEQPVEHFAFSGGHYNRKFLKLMQTFNYKAACSCLQGLNNLKTNPYLLKRIEIRKKFSSVDFKTVFSPVNIAFYQFVDLWKNIIRRSIGLEAYSRLRSKFYNYYVFKR